MKNITIILTLLLGYGVVFNCHSQDEKVDPRLDISYFKSGDDLPYLKIRVRKRIERRYFPMTGVQARVYFGEESKDNLIGEITTDDKGEGIVSIPSALMSTWNYQDSFEFLAFMAETDSTEEVMESLEIVKSRIRLSTSEDSVITAIFERKGEEGWVPEEEVELKVFLKRHFGKLPATEDYLETDEDGVLDFKFEQQVPGDKDGKLTFGVMIEDHDEFGNVTAFTTTNWGVPTMDDNTTFSKRTLWATRDKVPIWLLLLANFIIAGVWGVIIYLGVQIYKIKKVVTV